MLTCTFSLLSLFFSYFCIIFTRSALSILILFNDCFLCCKETICVFLNCLAYASILFKNLSHILKVIAFISLIGFNRLACLIFLNSVYIFNVNFKMIMKQ